MDVKPPHCLPVYMQTPVVPPGSDPYLCRLNSAKIRAWAYCHPISAVCVTSKIYASKPLIAMQSFPRREFLGSISRTDTNESSNAHQRAYQIMPTDFSQT